MSKQCAFCPHIGKLSAEHVISNWINALFPGKKLFTVKDEKGRIIRREAKLKIDWTAKVVCKKCNETWMSDIESQHAKRVISDLIEGRVNVPISASDARSVALFAYKTAVVIDHSQRSRQPFFAERVRYAFREGFQIPTSVQMWMCRFGPRTRGEIHALYHSGQVSPTNPIHFYVCTVAIGHFVFQVVAVKQIDGSGFFPKPGFEDISVPLWPRVPSNFVWPAQDILRTEADFEEYSLRWGTVSVTRPRAKQAPATSTKR